MRCRWLRRPRCTEVQIVVVRARAVVAGKRRTGTPAAGRRPRLVVIIRAAIRNRTTMAHALQVLVAVIMVAAGATVAVQRLEVGGPTATEAVMMDADQSLLLRIVFLGE